MLTRPLAHPSWRGTLIDFLIIIIIILLRHRSLGRGSRQRAGRRRWGSTGSLSVVLVRVILIFVIRRRHWLGRRRWRYASWSINRLSWWRRRHSSGGINGFSW